MCVGGTAFGVCWMYLNVRVLKESLTSELCVTAIADGSVASPDEWEAIYGASSRSPLGCTIVSAGELGLGKLAMVTVPFCSDLLAVSAKGYVHSDDVSADDGLDLGLGGDGKDVVGCGTDSSVVDVLS